ncbi:growth hormone secretagogue receptor type 1-like, partial [Patella vulgata]|uniref:growth hormone secretagogue receptor type 1-like n=1 Tax=Patella vulgata TaxID=6465 RepID=UPI00217FBFAA
NIGYLAIPVFLVIGLSGNTLTIIVMLSQQFRKMSFSVILVALALSDTTLIIMLPFNKGFVREILGVDIRALSSAGCKLFFFMFRSAKMTSSWFVVFLCLEKFVAVWFPLKIKFICTKRNAYIGLIIFREIAQILEQLNYSINFFLYVVCSKSFRNRMKCQ